LAVALAVLLTLSLLAPAPAWAGRLVMDVAAQVQFRPDKLEVRLEVTNRGDEPATDVQAEVLGQDRPVRSALLARLSPGQRAPLSLDLPRPQAGPGRYAAVVRVIFHDLNRRPFSALAQAYYHLGQDQASQLIVKAAPLNLADRKRVVLKLINTEALPLTVRARVMTPRELSASQIRGPVVLGPSQVRDVSFDLWNLGGLADSAYPLLVALEHDQAGLHTVKMVKLKVRLVKKVNFIRRRLGWWLAAIGLALSLLVYAQIRARRRS